MKIYKDYIITYKLDLNLVEIKNSCYKMKEVIDEKFKKQILDTNLIYYAT